MGYEKAKNTKEWGWEMTKLEGLQTSLEKLHSPFLHKYVYKTSHYKYCFLGFNGSTVFDLLYVCMYLYTAHITDQSI